MVEDSSDPAAFREIDTEDYHQHSKDYNEDYDDYSDNIPSYLLEIHNNVDNSPGIKNEVIIIRNNGLGLSDEEEKQVIQVPSAEVPDQRNPERYVNTNRYTLARVINDPLYYADISPLYQNRNIQYNRLFN